MVAGLCTLRLGERIGADSRTHDVPAQVRRASLVLEVFDGRVDRCLQCTTKQKRAKHLTPAWSL